ncbi:hypothetical protein BRD00_10505 [Halobacteriales archaeon QS_8_69_26]|nr:MAG: hypothetical protein BRD00_10505 [Halobacteriales archaeon QS_8_69_26]
MVSVGSVVGLLVVVGGHTLITVVVTRFFRIRMNTSWGAAVYAATVTPVVLLVTTLLLTGPLGIGAWLGDRTLALFVVLFFPLGLGYAIDLFWLRSPEEIAEEMDLPDTTDRRRPGRRE